MEVRPPRERVEITGDQLLAPPSSSPSVDVASFTSPSTTTPLKVEVLPNLADHPLVSGPRYTESHLSIRLLNNPGWYASGLVLGLIGPATGQLGHRFARHRLPRVYELKGELGLATDNHLDTGRVMVKSTWRHVTRERYERVLAKIEAAQRSGVFTVAGVDLRSEEAYQMALEGGMAPPRSKETSEFDFSNLNLS